MSREKLETGAMLNPRCQKCRKKDKCNNKTLCAYLIPKEIKVDRIKADSITPVQAPIKLTPEMIEKQMQKEIINKSFNIGVDFCYDKDKQISQHQSYL